MTDDGLEPMPRSDALVNVDRSPSGALNTAARALVVGAALGTPDALDEIGSDIGELGFEGLPEQWGTWADRSDLHDASNVILRGYGLIDEIRAREANMRLPDEGSELLAARAEVWPEVARGDRAACVAWLRMVMTDSEPIAATAAATALADWDHNENSPIPQGFESARQMTLLLARSARPLLAREIAAAAIGARLDTELLAPGPRGDAQRRGPVSLLIHGTYAWPGEWWYPGGDFHTFVLEQLRPDLYSGGSPYQWSGDYNGAHRKVAAKRLADWALETSGGALNTIFAHSYGGIVALLATTHGLRFNELVLLSVPAEKINLDPATLGRIVSIRIHLDLVLLAARRKQRFRPPVEENHLHSWFVHHADTHDVKVWLKNNLGSELHLSVGAT